jgi:alkyl sulfatase BDS1-like metallo-beta-lactamase superfamily hydrolase
MNANWRNYYLCSAMELDDQVPEAIYTHEVGKMLGTAMAALPPENQVGALPARLKAEETFETDLVAGIRYSNGGDSFRLHLRRGILEVSRAPLDGAVFTIAVTQSTMGAFLGGRGFDASFDATSITGDAKVAAAFFAHFETPFQRKPEVVVR